MGLFSGRGKPLSIFKRGVKKAKAEDYAGAVADYNLVIEMPNASSEVKSMALFNRALAYAGENDYPRAIEDLESVLNSSDTPSDVQSAAKQKLLRIKKHRT